MLRYFKAALKHRFVENTIHTNINYIIYYIGHELQVSLHALFGFVGTLPARSRAEAMSGRRALFVWHDKLFGKIKDVVEIFNRIIFRFAENFDGDEFVDDFTEVACLLDVPCVENVDGRWPETIDEGVSEETA